jgi:hypothetical protein
VACYRAHFEAGAPGRSLLANADIRRLSDRADQRALVKEVTAAMSRKLTPKK